MQETARHTPTGWLHHSNNNPAAEFSHTFRVTHAPVL